MTAYEKILEYVADLMIVDTHEHLPDNPDRREKPTDVLREYLTHYFDKDLISAGLPPKTLEYVRDAEKPLMDRWRAVAPYWELARNTGYARALDIAARELHGVDGIHEGTLEALDKSFQKTLDDPGWFRFVLREKSRIAVSILDGWQDYNSAPRWSELFAPVWRIDSHVMLTGFGDTIGWLAERNGMRVRSFTDYLELIDADIEKSKTLGYAGYKLGVAYVRPLRFDRVGFAEADREFESLMSMTLGSGWHAEAMKAPRALQDYCLHRCLRAIEKTGLPLQIHTGLQEGSGNMLAHSDPVLLNNLFTQYPDLKFDLFHIGYPYWQTLAAFAKNYPNVFIDMCWANIISPEACVNAVLEYTDSVPSNKVSAFGGDYLMVDPVYGHQMMARRNVSFALAQKVERGVFGLDDAKLLARRMFVDNPAALFNLRV